MGRYSKSYSNYVLRKRHQTASGGTIFERDWGTLGERHVIESGKRSVYADSSFLFTDNTRMGNRHRNNTGEWSAPYTLDDLGDKVDNTVNDTSRLSESNDIRDYAYYGSAVELVRVSIENIIKWFPGKFWASENPISRANDSNDERMYILNIITDGHHNYAIEYTSNQDECEIYVVENPFTIDFYTTNPTFNQFTNELRNMPQSFKQYELNGNDISAWDVWIKPYNECDGDYTIKYDIKFSYDDNGTKKSGHLYGISLDGEVVWCTNAKSLNVQPKANIIESYFQELDGFEAKLLNRKYNPEYTAKLITPIPYGNNNPKYSYVERPYTWPHDGYCIFVTSIGFENYVNSLYDLANTMDELWCDNIWRNMTHEAITNFDWTYTKNYEEGQEMENILGGTRMEGILRIWGRCFDDIKRYVDGISLKNCITYDSTLPNLGNAELSDKAELLGWEIYSTKLNKDDNIYLDDDFAEDYNIKWYDSMNIATVSQNDVDNRFMTKLVLSSAEIFRTKGTKHGIDMAFALFGIGDNDITMTERYYSVEPKRRDDDFWYYKLNSDAPTTDAENSDYRSFNDFIAHWKTHWKEYQNNTPSTLVINGQSYVKTKMKVGEFCEEMIIDKSAALYYEDDEFSGTPIKDVCINNGHYIVPYFTQKQIYDGYVHFESKGGWGKMVPRNFDFDTIKQQEFDYLETIPYMEIAQNTSELLEANTFQIDNKKVFYVIDISDFTDTFSEVVPLTISHFFILKDPNHPNNPASWVNIPSDGVPVPGVVSEDDIKTVEYNDKMALDNLGNNPHSGYGSYDLGSEYREYLETPFKYSVDSYGFSDPASRDSAAQFIFDVTVHEEVCGETDKKIFNKTKRDTGCTNVDTQTDTTPEYYLPSKILVIRNNINDTNYKGYLKNVVMKYVLQVIPSTTILILENME